MPCKKKPLTMSADSTFASQQKALRRQFSYSDDYSAGAGIRKRHVKKTRLGFAIFLIRKSARISGPRARWRGETRDFAEICSKSSLSASEIAKFSPAARSPPPIAKNQKFRRRNRYFGEAPAHECPIILYQENDSEGYETQKFSAERADAVGKPPDDPARKIQMYRYSK